MIDSVLIAFSLLTLASAMGVVFSRSVITSALSLILTMFSLAGIFVLLGSPFLAAIQILIYAGAIVVLFVFVVMLLDQDRLQDAIPSMWSALVAGALTFSFSLLLLRGFNRQHLVVWASAKVPTIQDVSLSLFGEFLWPFEVLSVFLLMVIVGVALLAGERKKL